MVTKGFMCERWVGDLTKTATYCPLQLFLQYQNFFPVLLGCSTRGLGAQPLLGLVLTPRTGTLTSNSDLQLTWTSCGTRLYNRLMSTCFSEYYICTQFNPSTVKVIPWHLRPDAPVTYTGAFLIWLLGWVGGQYVTTLDPYLIRISGEILGK